MLSNDCAVTELQRNSDSQKRKCSFLLKCCAIWYLHNTPGCTVFKISYLIPLEYNHAKRKAVKGMFWVESVQALVHLSKKNLIVRESTSLKCDLSSCANPT